MHPDGLGLAATGLPAAAPAAAAAGGAAASTVASPRPRPAKSLGDLEDVAHVGLLATVVALCVLAAMVLPRLPPHLRNLVRHGGFIALHLLDYASHVIMMGIVWTMPGQRMFLFALVPAHLTIGLFCLYTAATTTDWQKWGCAPICNLLFLIIVLGFMQGIQVKLALDDFNQQRAVRRGDEEEAARAPAMMPARFHCKAIDGILESNVFAFVAMLLLLKRKWIMPNEVILQTWQTFLLYASALLGFATTGLALLEVDHRTSVAVQQLLNRSAFSQLRHLAFRASEFALRLFTLLAFFFSMEAAQIPPAATFGVLGADYLLGVLLLVFLGGRDPVHNAAVVLGIPLLVVNVMQFVDAPGMSLQARRISSIIVPLRLAELLAVIIACTAVTRRIPVRKDGGSSGSDEEEDQFWNYLLLHREWATNWLLSGICYVVLLVTYALKVKPGADLHRAVADGDVECLESLLRSSELVLDINRYGPDGRTPLHLAALRGQIECMRLLIEEGANLHARTGNQIRNTALHLAAMGRSPDAVSYLCRMSNGNGAFLNAQNTEGNTALHLAARSQNVEALRDLLREPAVDLKMKNKRGRTPADCAPSDKFGFDKNSAESIVAELLRQAEAGSPPPAPGASVFEMAHIQSSTTGGDCIAGEASGNLTLRHTSTMVTGAATSYEASLAHQDRRNIPLVALRPTEEREFLLRYSAARVNSSRNEAVNVTHCGISSFMLSAGLGALSHAFLDSIREEPDGGPVDERSSVRASFDDFVEIKAIGEGAFGKVTLVRQKETGDVFAMKLMDKAKFKAQRITSKAISEQYILKTTRFPFIVSLHYAFQGSTFWALVMDFCPNGDLQNLLGTYGIPGLPYHEIARYCGEVMLAIEHLHSIRVIFRDLKLENVVIDKDHRARVTDFGLAKKLQTEADAKTMCGSYGYAAPEIILNKGRYTYAVDLYSFGVMFYMMLSGGEPSPKAPKQRLPPMRHASLGRKVREARKDAEWAREEVGAISLLQQCISEDPAVRTTATQLKQHRFFWHHLGRPVDSLLADPGRFSAPSLNHIP